MVVRHTLAFGASAVSSVTPGRIRAREQRCIWPGCTAILARDHNGLICGHHVRGYNIRHDRDSAGLVLHLLLAAYPRRIDLLDLLSTSDKDGVRCVIRRLRRRGHEITGYGVGYKYELPAVNGRQRRTTVSRLPVCKPKK